ncbi:MAG: hypothetical protein Rubg2KO_28590 [Rubricoccaceae bacterium]
MVRILLLTLALATGCSTTAPEPPTGEATSLPLLASGFTLGTTFYGSGDLDALGATERALLSDGVARGMTGFALYVDWGDLEPSKGHYTLDRFEETLSALRQFGFTPFVNITVGDIGDMNLPEELSDGEGGYADGIALDDEAVLDRFGALLDRVVPIVLANGGFLLNVGNEIDDRLDGDFRNEHDAYVRFVEAARERVHAIEPKLAVGVTLTTRPVREQTRTFTAMRGAADVVAFNYGPIESDLSVSDVDDIRSDFQNTIARFGDGPIVIQELTCPTASSMGSSEDWQRTCYETLLEEIAATPQVRFASVFTFQDFDAETCQVIQDALALDDAEGLPDNFVERYTEYLCTMGVVRPDGTPKPAWDVILDATD